jgi:hypothetical protein
MKIFSTNSRFSYGILLVLLVISISGIFFSLHNQIIQAQAKTPLLAVLFTIASIALAILIFQRLIAGISVNNNYVKELEQLKKAILERTRQEEAAQEDFVEQQAAIDHEAEAIAYIPKEKFDSEEKFLEVLLSNIAKTNDIVQSIAFKKNEETSMFEMIASYAYYSESAPPTFAEGETLPGQVAKNQVALNLSEVPNDYITVLSGLGKGTPKHLLIVPIISSEHISTGVLEFASFKEFTSDKVKTLEKLGLLLNEHISRIGNSIEE